MATGSAEEFRRLRGDFEAAAALFDGRAGTAQGSAAGPGAAR